MTLLIPSFVTSYLLLIFTFTVKFVQSNPQIQIGNSDDVWKKQFNSDPFPTSSSGFGSDWHAKTRSDYNIEFESHRATSLIAFWIIGGIIILSIISTCVCFFVPACWLAKVINKRRRREQGQIFSPTEIHAYPAQAQTGPVVYPTTATMNQSNYPYGPMPQQPLATQHLQQGSYYQSDPTHGATNLGGDTNWQPPYSPYHTGNNHSAFPGPMANNLPPTYRNQ